ncbi:MAG TPA: nodulation protein NfeD [Gaiellaceae bacterium]|nr:nodulation protein NfeD [Gaiellaceae bacterium]
MALLLVSGQAVGASGRPRVLAVKFALDVSPPTADYVKSEIDHAASAHYDAVVIEIDTPGGLSDSMRSIYQKELASKIPVIVYVAPNGARAASAGVWISEAADVLAMSPISNIGSSTPVNFGGGTITGSEAKKTINDAAASLISLALAHHRNSAFANAAVRGAANYPAQKALRLHVVDAIAPSLPALLKQLDGYHTKDAQRPFTLHLANAQIDTVSPGFITRLLDTAIDPNLISILFLAGIVGLIFEVFHPGVVLPGALGAVSLVISLYGFSILNPSWGGLVLVILGVALLVVDLHAVTHGVLTTGGLIALGFGLALLFQNQPAPYHVDTWLVTGIGIAIAGLWALALSKGLAARRRPVTSGKASMVGLHGIVRGGNVVVVRGELWNANSSDGQPLVPGEEVVVETVEGGLTLRVRSAGVHAPA